MRLGIKLVRVRGGHATGEARVQQGLLVRWWFVGWLEDETTLFEVRFGKGKNVTDWAKIQN